MTATEHLTTGWEPDLDATDSMLRRYLHAWVGQCDAFVTSLGGEVMVTDAWALADARRPTGLFNAATLLSPLPFDDADAVLDDVEAAIEGGTGEVHLWSAWPTPDLRARGWELVGHPPLLVRPPASVLAPPARPDVDLRPVADPEDLVEWERVVVDGFPLPEVRPSGAVAGAGLIEDDRLRLTLGYEGGRPVSAGALFTHDGLGLFALAATEPAARGRGHWRAHAADRLEAAPDVWMAGAFADLSRPLAEAIGFVPLLRFTLWSRPRP